MKPDFARMDAADRDAAFGLFLDFLQAEPHYRDVASVYGDGGPGALRRALDLFVERPELGFVWMGRRGGEVVGCCVACFAISTSRGTLVAKLDDVNVRPGLEGQGIGSAMLESLKEELRRLGVTRIDTATHFDNPGARRFYERHGFGVVVVEDATEEAATHTEARRDGRDGDPARDLLDVRLPATLRLDVP